MRFQKLAKNIEWFKEALKLPVLTLADIPEPLRNSESKHDRSGNISHEQLMAELGLAEVSTVN